VSGHLWAADPTFEGPVSLVAFVGTEDPVNPIKEGVTRTTSYVNTPKPQVRDSVRRWARALGLPADSELKYVSEDVFRERWGPGENGAEAVFYIVEGLGHQWPGGTRISPNERLGPTSDALDATAVMWEFFAGHPGGDR
jgi:polyhydroxybutyrate depolymerase